MCSSPEERQQSPALGWQAILLHVVHVYVHVHEIERIRHAPVGPPRLSLSVVSLCCCFSWLCKYKINESNEIKLCCVLLQCVCVCLLNQSRMRHDTNVTLQ
jgi:hypothetical protein